jgi:hypothetical protein
VKRLALVVVMACSSAPDPVAPLPTTPVDAPVVDAPAPAPAPAPVDAVPAVTTPTAAKPRPWLKGNTHTHAKPSGDSTTPIPEVIAWYEAHGYDFIALTDHNRVSEVDADTTGKPYVRNPTTATGLIVLSGIELTFNPDVCLPQDPGMKCRIHANGLGVTKRPVDKLEWADRQTDQRVAMYERALTTIADLGGLAQLNHPQWQWGMTSDVLNALALRGFKLVEIENRQFDNWNAGDGLHPSTEALWDAALTAGIELWGVASDDAHHYQADGGGRYPAGGGWVMVRAERDPAAILAALAAGEFYATTGVTLSRAEAEAGELVVEVDPSSPGEHAIAFYSQGQLVHAVVARSARVAIPRGGYVRAVVRRQTDGAKAWVQPARVR